MSDNQEVREIKVLGAKPKDMIRKRRTRKARLVDDEEQEEVPIRQTSQPVVISKIQEVATPPPAAPAPAAPAPAPTPAAPAPVQKVVLKPKEKPAPKVILKKKEIVPGPVAPTPTIKGGGATTTPLKVKTRKVVLNSFHKRVNKTRHALSQAKELSLDNIRAVLIDKKLIKPNSKAPESILRQIYSDSLIVAKKTL